MRGLVLALIALACTPIYPHTPATSDSSLYAGPYITTNRPRNGDAALQRHQYAYLIRQPNEIQQRCGNYLGCIRHNPARSDIRQAWLVDSLAVALQLCSIMIAQDLEWSEDRIRREITNRTGEWSLPWMLQRFEDQPAPEPLCLRNKYHLRAGEFGLATRKEYADSAGLTVKRTGEIVDFWGRVVRYDDLSPVVNATVSIEDDDAIVRVGLTDSSGDFYFSVPVGRYEIALQVPGRAGYIGPYVFLVGEEGTKVNWAVD